MKKSAITCKDRHPSYWHPTILKLYDEIRSLKKFPNRGRSGREEGTRELSFSPLPYAAVYRITGDFIEVLRVYHAARNF